MSPGAAARGQSAHAGPPKTTRPLATHALPRPRLFRLLDRGRRQGVVWVVGPPGAGKTTLVAHYLARRRLSALWYQLDESDAEPATFFHYFGPAARGIGLDRPGRLPRLTLERRPALPLFARQYFGTLCAALRRPFAIVLDDYHTVQGGPVDVVVSEAARTLPAHGSLLVLSRAAPPPAVARLAASRRLAIVSADALRLTPAETLALARRLATRPLPGRLALELHPRTDGWAAGVVLALETLARRGLVEATLAETIEASTFDYFAGEVLAELDRGTRRFLLRTATLPVMTAASAAAITDERPAGAERRLARLSRRGYFTERRGGSPAAYVYHPLFRRFLQIRARDELAPAAFRHLQRRAAAIAGRQGLIADAVDLLAAAGAPEALARLIRAHAAALLAEERGHVVARWIDRLPARVLSRDPALLYWRGLCRLPLDPAGSRPDLERAFRLWERAGARQDALRAWQGVVDSILYEWNDLAALDPWLDWFVTHVAAAPGVAGPSEAEARLAASVFAALLFRRPQDPTIDAWADRAVRRASAAPSPTEQLLAGYPVAVHAFWRGDLVRAGLVTEMLRDAGRAEDASPLARLMWHQLEAIDHWHRADAHACEEAVGRGLALAERTGVHLWTHQLLAQAVLGALSVGQRDRARSLLDRMERLLNRHRLLDVSLVHFLRGWHAALGGDLAGARREAERALDLAARAGAPWPEGLNRLTVARLLHATGDRAGAARQLARGRRIADATQSAMLGFLAGVVDAEMAYARAAHQDGEAALRRTMRIGRERQLWNTPWWLPDRMADLAVRALEAGIEPEYVRELVRRRRLAPSVPPVHLPDWPWRLRVVTLGRCAVERDGVRLDVGGRGGRPLRLLWALIALGGREVPLTRLADLIWPDGTGDAARRALDTTLHRLRRLLGLGDAIVVHAGRASLDPRRCWIDVWAFEHLLQREDPGAPGGPARLERAVGLYRGLFLDGEDELPWAGPLRDRLRRQFVRAVTRLAAAHEAAGDRERAIDACERGLEVEPLEEGLYRGLMTCHARAGRPAEVLAAYARCRDALAAGLGAEPGPATVAILRRIPPGAPSEGARRGAAEARARDGSRG